MYTKYLQVDRDLPHYIWGSVTIYNFKLAEVEQESSTVQFFATGPPRHSSPPVAHVRGESSPAFGLHLLMS